MTDAAREEAWQHTAWLACLIANANRNPKKKPSPFTPDDFNPMVSRRQRKRRGIRVTKENIGDLRAMFEGMKGTRP